MNVQNNNSDGENYISPSMKQAYYEEPFVVMVARLTFEVMLAFVGLVGNITVSFVISRQRKFRSGLKLFIRNLALADIGILAISFPIAVAKEQLPLHWPFGKVGCLYFYPLAEVFHGVSVWSITAIAIERYRKISTFNGFRCSTYISTKPLKWVIVVIWIVSFLVVTFPLLFVMNFVEDPTVTYCDVAWSHTIHIVYIISMTIFWYLLPLGIIVFTYAKITRQLQHSNNFHRSIIKQRSREKNIRDSHISMRFTGEEKRMRQNSKAKKILTPIVLVFTISMLPLNFLRVLLVFWKEFFFEKFFWMIYNICVIGVVINSASDPLIYSIVSKDFRLQLKEISSRFTQRLHNVVRLRRDDKNGIRDKTIGIKGTPREYKLDEEKAIFVTTV
ncbi:neuropeptide Y receptor type 6-like [Stylophora pistillata]|uniref:neuropeptide Y receptor type 6-like n=1 Tax=Stylophora pistillata TaxID=50429 RepID=UPI000C039450|nr:neuropeptide Y receptor type 6-like [Stylophora pistillata]